MLAAALEKSILGPPKNFICPRDRTVLQLVPVEAPGPVTAKRVCLVPFGHWKNEYPKAWKGGNSRSCGAC